MASQLRQLQAAWNELVPQAQARGIPRVRMLNAPLETIQYRRDKLNWLKGLLATTASAIQFSYGVEIECLMPAGSDKTILASRIVAAGIPCEVQSYNHRPSGVWKIVTDASLGDTARGIELVSPILHEQGGMEAIAKVADVLKAFGCKVTKKCGFHVHVGARDENVSFFRNLAKLYASAETTIDSFMAPSRRGNENTYARTIYMNRNELDRATTLNGIALAMGCTPNNHRSAGRYRKLNFQSYWQHGTVEFRQHQGTVESLKMTSWTRLCLLMCAAAKDGASDARTLEELMTVTKASQAEKNYFASRVSFFNRGIPRSDVFSAAANDISARATTRGQI